MLVHVSGTSTMTRTWLLQCFISHVCCFSPSGTVYNDLELGDWLAKQLRNVRDGSLPVSRRKLLEDLGYSDIIAESTREKSSESSPEQEWDEEGMTDPWIQMFFTLRHYKDSVGSCFW